jgi:hypothetical protein
VIELRSDCDAIALTRRPGRAPTGLLWCCSTDRGALTDAGPGDSRKVQGDSRTVQRGDDMTDSVETRGDQRDELLAVDTNQDGAADVLAIDTDGNGKADLFQLDSDGDGNINVTMVDLDEDGIMDTKVDGDGGHAPTN